MCALALCVVVFSSRAVLPSGPAEPRRFIAPAGVTAEIRAAVERARGRFEARDAAGVLANVSEHYRSAGVTKAAVRQQLLAMFAVYEELRVRVRVDRVEVVDGRTEIFTTGDVSGRMPFVGWVTVLTWENQPEVARHENGVWRLIGFQD
jgi:hypothetical protein